MVRFKKGYFYLKIVQICNRVAQRESVALQKDIFHFLFLRNFEFTHPCINQITIQWQRRIRSLICHLARRSITAKVAINAELKIFQQCDSVFLSCVISLFRIFRDVFAYFFDAETGEDAGL
jgi:hypothetical protein